VPFVEGVVVRLMAAGPARWSRRTRSPWLSRRQKVVPARLNDRIRLTGLIDEGDTPCFIENVTQQWSVRLPIRVDECMTCGYPRRNSNSE
jgi:hypothetical protein